MSLHTWSLFLLTVFVLSGTPGPNMLHVMARGVSVGARRTVMAMAGCLAAVLLMLSASAAGLGALLQASPKVFEALRYLGVGYLVWLGIRAWLSSEETPKASAPDPGPGLAHWQLFRGGLLVGLSNPKLLLFATAFLPQFIDQARPQVLQFATLIVTFAFCELFWYAVYALGGHRLRLYLSKPLARRAFDRVTGTIFVGFGVLLLRFRPQ